MVRPTSRDEILSDLHGCYEKHGKVNGKILNSDSEFCCRKTVYNEFGSFPEACEEADVPHHHPQKKEKVEVECRRCGSVDEVYPHRAEKEFPEGEKENCGECMDRKVTVECGWCDGEVQIHRYRVGEPENHFCDQECHGRWKSEMLRGEDHPRYSGGTIIGMGSEWSEVREERIEIDGEACVVCGMSREEHREEYDRDIEVHHIVPRSTFQEADGMEIDDSNHMANLVTLCKLHHRQSEAGEIAW